LKPLKIKHLQIFASAFFMPLNIFFRFLG